MLLGYTVGTYEPRCFSCFFPPFLQKKKFPTFPRKMEDVGILHKTGHEPNLKCTMMMCYMQWYCWWTTSHTSWYGRCHIIYSVLMLYLSQLVQEFPSNRGFFKQICTKVFSSKSDDLIMRWSWSVGIKAMGWITPRDHNFRITIRVAIQQIPRTLFNAWTLHEQVFDPKSKRALKKASGYNTTIPSRTPEFFLCNFNFYLLWIVKYPPWN